MSGRFRFGRQIGKSPAKMVVERRCDEFMFEDAQAPPTEPEAKQGEL
jgi:hypothetical protein